MAMPVSREAAFSGNDNIGAENRGNETYRVNDSSGNETDRVNKLMSVSGKPGAPLFAEIRGFAGDA